MGEILQESTEREVSRKFVGGLLRAQNKGEQFRSPLALGEVDDAGSFFDLEIVW